MNQIIEKCPLCGSRETSFEIRIETDRQLFSDVIKNIFYGTIKCKACGCKLEHKVECDNNSLIVSQSTQKTTQIIGDETIAMFDEIRHETITKWNNRSAS